MLKRLRFVALALAVAAAAGILGACKQSGTPRVLLISLDGFRWDYRERFDTPALDAIAAAGVSAKYLQPAFPSKTFPNHFTLVTGLVPDHHGIISNSMRDPRIPGVTFTMGNREAVVDPSWWEAEPIWTQLEKLGKRTAPLLWPGSEAPHDGVMPDDWVKYSQEISDDERIAMVTKLFERPEAEWPDFATMYWHDIDTAGHRESPDSEEMRAVVERVDGAVGRLVTRLRALNVEINVVVASDHGMSAQSPERAIYLDDYLDMDTVDTVDSSPNIALFPATATADEVYARLAGKHPHLRVYRRGDYPARLNFGTHPRVPPIYAMADEGWQIITRRRPDRTPSSGGAHGYDNETLAMQGLFVAAGPAIKPGVRLERYRSIDVYELMCGILGVTPRTNDGSRQAARALLR